MAYKPSAETLARAALARSKMSSARKTKSKTDVEGRSAAAAKKVKVAPRKTVAIEPNSVRALNAARQKEYMARGGRQPIGAMGSGGGNVMAGAGQFTIKDIKASIKAGFNPRVSLDPYESERAKKVGPRSLKLKKKSVDEALSPERKRMFDLKLKLIKKVANTKNRAKISKVDEPRTSLNPSADFKLNARPVSGPADAVGYYKEQSETKKTPSNYPGQKLQRDYLDRYRRKPQEDWKTKQDREYGLATGYKAGRWAFGGKYEEVEKVEEGKMKDIATDRAETERLLPFTPDKKKVRRGLGGPMSQVKWLAKQAMMKKAKELQKEEVVLEEPQSEADKGEYDYEGDMAKSQLRSILANAKRLHDMLKPDSNLPEWVQSKITLAEDYILTAANYMEGEMNEEFTDEKLSQIDEKAMSDAQMKKREKYVKSMKPVSDWEKRYPGRGEQVMYATATKMAMKEEAEVVEETTEEVEQIEEKYMGFKALKASIAAKGGVRDPAAVAAAIGRKKYGKEKFQAMAAAGKKANEEVEQIDEVGGLVSAVKKYGEAGAAHDEIGSKETRSALSVAKKQMTVAAKERGIDPKRAIKVADRITMRSHGDDSYKTNRVGKMKEEVEQIDEDHAAAYDKHMTAHYNAAERGDWDTAETHAQRAEKAADRHFKATGKKIYDPGYTGGSKHVTQVKEDVEQIDELKKSTLASYVNKAAHQVRAKSGIAASFETSGTRKRNPENKSAYMDVAKDFRQGAKKRLIGIEKATAKLSKEEVEQVTEAEGTVAVTPKEKALAAHHGDKTKITYGDVIKARLKSAAEKAMKAGK